MLSFIGEQVKIYQESKGEAGSLKRFNPNLK